MCCNVLQRAEYLAVHIQNGIWIQFECVLGILRLSIWWISGCNVCSGNCHNPAYPVRVSSETQRKKERKSFHSFVLVSLRGAYRLYRLSASSQDERTDMYGGLN